MSDDIPSAHHITVVACQHDLIGANLHRRGGEIYAHFHLTADRWVQFVDNIHDLIEEHIGPQPGDPVH